MFKSDAPAIGAPNLHLNQCIKKFSFYIIGMLIIFLNIDFGAFIKKGYQDFIYYKDAKF